MSSPRANTLPLMHPLARASEPLHLHFVPALPDLMLLHFPRGPLGSVLRRHAASVGLARCPFQRRLRAPVPASLLRRRLSMAGSTASSAAILSPVTASSCSRSAFASSVTSSALCRVRLISTWKLFRVVRWRWRASATAITWLTVRPWNPCTIDAHAWSRWQSCGSRLWSDQTAEAGARVELLFQPLAGRQRARPVGEFAHRGDAVRAVRHPHLLARVLWVADGELGARLRRHAGGVPVVTLVFSAMCQTGSATVQNAATNSEARST